MGLFGRRDIWLAARLSFSPLLFPYKPETMVKTTEDTPFQKFMYRFVAWLFAAFMLWALYQSITQGVYPESGGEQSVMEYYGIF